MKCSEASQVIMRYLDGEANDLDLYHLKQHIKYCNACSQEYRFIGEIIDYQKEQLMLDPPESFTVNVMQAVKENTNSKINLIGVPLKILSIFAVSLLIIFSAWVFIILQDVSLFSLIDTTINTWNIAELVKDILQIFQNGYKTAVIVGHSIFNVYYILLTNYYDILFSLASVLIILYTLFSNVIRHQHE